MSYEEYVKLYPGTAAEADFLRLRILADRQLHAAATGVDGVDKLAVAPPAEPECAQALEHCRAALIYALWQIEQAQALSPLADGSVAGRQIASVTAGAESVSYAVPARSGEDRQTAADRITREYLSGLRDANGVPLLYTGRYPKA